MSDSTVRPTSESSIRPTSEPLDRPTSKAASHAIIITTPEACGHSSAAPSVSACSSPPPPPAPLAPLAPLLAEPVLCARRRGWGRDESTASGGGAREEEGPGEEEEAARGTERGARGLRLG
eukprot:3442317-Rhodomonas_salina.1